MDLDWIEDFLALAAHRNFTRAADIRHVSQPAFSRRIRALEDWVGAPLFLRGMTPTAPTLAGEAFHPAAEAIMRELHRGRRDAKAAAQAGRGLLSLAATHALSFTFFPDWMRRHLDAGDGGTIALVSDSLDGCERAMRDGDVHFLLCHHHAAAPPLFDPERFETRTIGRDALAPFSAPDGDDRPLWSLHGPTRLLGYGAASGLGRILARARPTDADTPAPLFTSHLAATLLSMAREGHGLAWLPATLAARDLAEGRLVRCGDDQIAVEIVLVRSPTRRGTTADALWARSIAMEQADA